MVRGSTLYRLSKPVVAISIASSVLAAAQRPQSASEAVASAREALGGTHVDAVKALLLQGESRALNLANSQMSPPTLLEIRILMPDHYVRIERTESMERRSGFSGQTVLNAIKPLKPDVNVSGSWGPEQIKTERNTVARLLLGALVRSDMLQGLRPVSASGHTIAFEAPDGFAATLELDAATRIPVRLTYRSFVRFPPPSGQPITGPPPGTDADVTVTFGERRAVAGVLLPHRITTTAKELALSELRFHKIVVNSGLTRDDFSK